MSDRFERFVDELFPFHLRTDASLRILDCGKSLPKLMPEPPAGYALDDRLVLISPRGKFGIEMVRRHQQATFLFRIADSDVLLRGQFYPLESVGEFLFLCSPWLDSPDQLQAHGLKETDFAPFESTIEHLYLAFTRAQQLEELQTVNQRLQETIRKSEELANAEAALSRDLEVAADLRLQVADDRVSRLTVNAAALEPLLDVLGPGTAIGDCPDWLRQALASAPAPGERSSARKVNASLPSGVRALDLRMSRISAREIILVGRDISEEQAEYLLLLKTLEQAMESVVMIDEDERISFFNAAAQSLFGYTRDEAMGQPIELLSNRGLSPRQDAPQTAWLRNDTSSGQRGEVTLWRKDQAELLCSYSVSRVRVGNQAVTTAFIQDITLQREAEQRISFQANHDGLTGLANRRFFQQRLNQMLEQGAGNQVAVALIDMDDFKTVNDLLGHDAGDEFLRQAAERLRRSIRDADFACRLGGDEFALILASVPNQSAANRVIDRVVETLTEPLLIDNVNWEPSASIGVAIGGKEVDGADLLRNADLAMYEAKSQGKGRACFYTPRLTERAQHRITMQKRLEQALDKREIVAYFQPIIDLTTGRPKSFEALCRWQAEDGTLVPPAEFIPLAEASDLITKIEDQVIRQSLGVVRRLRRQYIEYADVGVSVNISAKHFANPRLVPMLREQLAAFDLAPDALTLELTESILLDSSAAVTRQFERLKSLGVRIALDDFGTGYSSLSYLDRFPFDVIKIDRSFVRDLGSEQVRRRLLEVMIAVGRVMGAQVVAEGIEQFEDETVLRELECTLGQGFLYAQPMPAEQLDVYLLGDITAGHRLAVAEA